MAAAAVVLLFLALLGLLAVLALLVSWDGEEDGV